jgi:cytidyltransferase-like protein|tara:strand:- start:5211 stop:5684 length:474 start_codon:yes stop_codon:yes gene_type:complete
MAHHYDDYRAYPEAKKRIMVSGGFDPIHKGHIRMIREATKKGEVIVVVNSDAWLIRKKGFVFMPFEERVEIIQSIKGVRDTQVIGIDDSDNTVCEALRKYRPHCFANGGDRTNTNTPEMAVCEELGIEMLWEVGGDKVQSSSTLTKGHIPKTNKPVC